MRTRNVPSGSSSQQQPNKMRTKQAVVEDVDEGDEDNNYDGLISGADDSDDADYVVDEEEDYAEANINIGDYEVESEYHVTEHTDKKRKIVPPPPKHVRPPQPPQPKVVRRAQRPLVIEPDHDEFVVQQPTLTLGEQVKKKGVLVATQLRNCSWKPANFNCRIGAFTDVVNAMGINDNKKQLLEQSGFGGLLKLPSTKIDRRFCYWLMARVDPEKKVLTGGDGRELPLCPEQ